MCQKNQFYAMNGLWSVMIDKLVKLGSCGLDIERFFISGIKLNGLEHWKKKLKITDFR